MRTIAKPWTIGQRTTTTTEWWQSNRIWELARTSCFLRIKVPQPKKDDAGLEAASKHWDGLQPF